MGTRAAPPTPATPPTSTGSRTTLVLGVLALARVRHPGPAGVRRQPRRRQPGRRRPHHLRPRAVGDRRLPRLLRHHPRLGACTSGRSRSGGTWWPTPAAEIAALFTALTLRHRHALGPAHLGRLLGLGRPPHLHRHADAAAARLPRRAAPPGRLPGAGQAGLDHRPAARPQRHHRATESVEWWRTAAPGPPPSASTPKIDGLMLFTLFFGFVVIGVFFAWLLIHRFRVAWLEEQVADQGLDAAIAERRAEGGTEAGRRRSHPTSRPGRPRRDRHLALRHRRLADRARRRSPPTPPSPSSAAARSPSRSRRSAVDGADPPHRARRRRRRRRPPAPATAPSPPPPAGPRKGRLPAIAAASWSWCSASASCWSRPSAAPRPSTTTSTRPSPSATTLGDKRFRLQGTVVAGTIDRTADGRDVHRHLQRRRGPRRSTSATRPSCSRPTIPVVLEGRLDAAAPTPSTPTACS